MTFLRSYLIKDMSGSCALPRIGGFMNSRTLGAALIAALVSATFYSHAASAATLLADGTYQNANDLTRINNGSTVLEFLDLPLTTAQTPTQALATYGSAGFTLATASQVTALFDAFGIVYGFVPDDVYDLGAVPNAASFVSHLGATQFGTYRRANSMRALAPTFVLDVHKILSTTTTSPSLLPSLVPLWSGPPPW